VAAFYGWTIWFYDRCGGGQQSRCQPPPVKLQIDFDLEFGAPFPDEHEEGEQQQQGT